MVLWISRLLVRCIISPQTPNRLISILDNRSEGHGVDIYIYIYIFYQNINFIFNFKVNYWQNVIIINMDLDDFILYIKFYLIMKII